MDYPSSSAILYLYFCCFVWLLVSHLGRVKRFDSDCKHCAQIYTFLLHASPPSSSCSCCSSSSISISISSPSSSPIVDRCYFIYSPRSLIPETHRPATGKVSRPRPQFTSRILGLWFREQLINTRLQVLHALACAHGRQTNQTAAPSTENGDEWIPWPVVCSLSLAKMSALAEGKRERGWDRLRTRTRIRTWVFQPERNSRERERERASDRWINWIYPFIRCFIHSCWPNLILFKRTPWLPLLFQEDSSYSFNY